MFQVEIYGRLRRAVRVGGRSQRAVGREFGISRETVRRMLEYAVPPRYQRHQPIKRPKLGPWVGVIDAILNETSTDLRNSGLRPSGSSSGSRQSTDSRVDTPS